MNDPHTDTTLTLSNYQTRLPSFEGPMDVLLRLIERQQLEIADVSLIQLTDQFLLFVEEMSAAPPEVIAEFTMVGTRLTLLKSRSLLPRPPLVDDPGEPDPSDLVRQLQAYKQFKEVAHLMGERRESGFVSFSPHTDGPVARPAHRAPLRLAQHDPSALLRSLRRRLSTVPQATRMIRQRPMVSIREMVERVVVFASVLPSFRFSDVTGELRTRSETATAFLAVLVMIRGRSLDASQEGLFGEIKLAGVSSPEVRAEALRDGTQDFINA